MSPTRVTSAEAAEVRWLARRVLPEDPGLEDLSAPMRVRDELRRSAAAREYVVGWARHPEVGGTFEAKTRRLRRLSDGPLLRVLTTLRYDGILYARDGAIMGHFFFQRHGDALHGFSVAVGAAFEGRGYSRVMMLDYVADASRSPGIVRARIGCGQNHVARGILERLKEHEERLGWRVQADGWVSFPGK
jgi:hypothetical protein